ncbi:MAG: hypothetical protein HC800_10895 [Phormidesmis sp. RL_2_1]|nr:hypothetical protein [Phormidesmis sp. RL_2_1]
MLSPLLYTHQRVHPNGFIYADTSIDEASIDEASVDGDGELCGQRCSLR